MKKARNILKKIIFENLKPEEFLDVVNWANNFRKLPKESAAVPGDWETAKTPYMEEIMKAITNIDISKISIMSSAQVGKTELILNIIGRYIDMEPCPILMVMPTVDLAKSFSHEKLTPMIRETKRLRKKVQQDNVDTILRKKFAGGFLKLIGAQSETELSSRSIRLVCMDEIDRFPQSVGKEGDPIELIDRRTTTFYNAKSIRTSTPTISGISKIEREFKKGTQEEFAVACPQCGENQIFKFDNLKWEKKDFDSVKMLCESCGCLDTEENWKYNKNTNYLKKGSWIAKNENKYHRSFHMNALNSPWISWKEIVQKFYEAKDDPNLLQTFFNTILGLPWVINKYSKDYTELLKRLIKIEHDVPENTKYITAGVDIQENRIEIEIVAWLKNGSPVGIRYSQLIGNTAEEKVWNDLDNLLNSEWSNGKDKLKIGVTFIDSGYNTLKVYKFVSDKANRNIFAIKGVGGEGKYPIINVTKIKKEGIPEINLINLGANSLKDTIYGQLEIADGEPGAYYFSDKQSARYNVEYFKGLTAEIKELKRVNGVTRIVWKVLEGRRNEPLDLRNYATAAAIFIENSQNIEVVEENEETIQEE